jgi:hypothetical protein
MVLPIVGIESVTVGLRTCRKSEPEQLQTVGLANLDKRDHHGIRNRLHTDNSTQYSYIETFNGRHK